MTLAEVELVRLVDEPHDLHVGRRILDLGGDGQEHDGQDAGALLAGRLGDQLLDPVGQADDVRAVGDQSELVATRAARPPGDRRREHERGVVGAVDRDLEQGRLGLVEKLGDVDAGETGRHEPERGERRVAAAHGRIGVEHACSRRRGPPASSGEPGSVTTTMRSSGSMPRSRNAASNARLAESVSTVEPDFDETTSTVCSRPPASASPSSAASTWLGAVESRITSGTPEVCAITSGASDEPPMPASTTRVTPLATSSARSASISATSGRDTIPPAPSRDAGMPRPRRPAPTATNRPR